jgi:hypothetical protein
MIKKTGGVVMMIADRGRIIDIGVIMLFDEVSSVSFLTSGFFKEAR